MDVQFHVASPGLLVKCMQVAGLNQRDLARVLEISDRTLHRWLNGSGGTILYPGWQRLARAVFPKDAAFAAKLAELGGATLETLGLVRPPPPATKALAPAPTSDVAPAASSRPATTSPVGFAAVLDSVVCAALDQGDFTSREVRPLLAAAFVRAHELGLSMEEVARAFLEPARPVAKSSRKSGAAASRVSPRLRLPPRR